MSFPDPTLAPPALAPFQLSFGGVTFGGVTPGSAYQLQSMSIDMPDVAAGDVQRALDHGEFTGLDVLPGVDMTVVQAVKSDGVSLDHAVQQLGGVLGPGGAQEQPLWLALPSGTFARNCRARKHNCPVDINRVFAGAVIATTLFHATDPRWYAAPSVSQTVGLPAPTGGASFPLTFPASFGAGGIGGVLAVVNTGRFESRPVLIVTGPCTNPRISNLSLPGAPTIAVNVTLAAGDVLRIDTDWQSVTLQSAGSSTFASRRNLLVWGSTWWNLPANSSSQIEFTTEDPAQVAGTLTVQSASAYLSV